jgi:hypothetical protein
MNLQYGENFKLIEKLYQGDNCSLGILKTNKLQLKDKFILHPSILDGAFQCFIGSIENSSHTYLPVKLNNIEVLKDNIIEDEIYIYCEVKNILENSINGDIIAVSKNLENNEITILFKVFGFICNKVPKQIYPISTYYLNYQSKIFNEISENDFKEIEIPKNLIEKYEKKWDNFYKLNDEINSIIAFYFKDAFSKIKDEQLPKTEDRIRYLNWAREVIVKYQAKDPETLKNVNPDFDIDIKILKKVGNSLKDLIINPKENSKVMFSDDVLNNFYLTSITFKPFLEFFRGIFQKIIEKVSKNQRVFKILEV